MSGRTSVGDDVEEFFLSRNRTRRRRGEPSKQKSTYESFFNDITTVNFKNH